MKLNTYQFLICCKLQLPYREIIEVKNNGNLCPVMVFVITRWDEWMTLEPSSG